MKGESRDASYWRGALARFFRHKLAMIGLVVFALEVVAVALAPPLLRLDPYTSDYEAFDAAPGAAHALGTDDLGRDQLARLLDGGRVSLFVGLLSTLVSALVGVPLGLMAAFYRGAFEALFMRLADIFMSFPSMILILVLVSVIGPSVLSVTLVIGLLGWPQFARQIYGSALSVRGKEYVEAARAVGCKDRAIIFKYILPNSFAPVLVTMTFRIAESVIQESSLSFLGMGVQPPQASWGNMLFNAQTITVLSTKLWLWLPPGIALVLLVLSINFIGDGLRDALDPKMKI